MRTIAARLALLLAAAAATPALAQFPPPGIYLCIDAKAMPVGTLTLFAAGDYEWTAEGGNSGKGQVSSAGTTVEALTGPLKDIAAKGSFELNEFGEASFALSSNKGELTCGLPPEHTGAS